MDTISFSSQGDSISQPGTQSAASHNDAYLSDDSEASRVRANKVVQVQEDRVKKGQYCWQLLQKSVHDAINLVQDTEIAEVSINHGVHHDRSISHQKPVQHIIYNSNNKVSASDLTVTSYLLPFYCLLFYGIYFVASTDHSA